MALPRSLFANLFLRQLVNKFILIIYNSSLYVYSTPLGLGLSIINNRWFYNTSISNDFTPVIVIYAPKSYVNFLENI